MMVASEVRLRNLFLPCSKGLTVGMHMAQHSNIRALRNVPGRDLPYSNRITFPYGVGLGSASSPKVVHSLPDTD